MTDAPKSVWVRFRANPSAVFGLTLLGVVGSFALFGPLLWAQAPNASDFSLASHETAGPPGPSALHPLGVDPLYRDVLARLAAGGRLSLSIALAATALALSLGTAIGVGAAAARSTRLRAIDDALMWLVDLALAFPYLLLVTAVGVALDRAGAVTIALVLGATSFIGIARLVRVRALDLLGRDDVLAARALGSTLPRIIQRHVLPGLRGTLLVLGSQSLGQMVLAEAVLGYLTVGVGPPQASWGRMLQEAEHYLGAAPRLVAAPAAAIVLTVFGFTRVADALAHAQGDRSPREVTNRATDAWLVLAALALLVGFSRGQPLDPPRLTSPAPEGGLRLATSLALGPLDPALANDEATLAVDELVHARLLRRTRDGSLTGELAESYRLSEDGLSLRLTLRPGLRFHDGKPLGAGDIKRSLERALHPETPCPAASEFAALAGFDAFRAKREKSLAGIEVASELDVIFHFDHPDAAFPSLLGLGYAAPVCAHEDVVRATSHDGLPCGAGPYRVTSRTESRLVLVRDDAYTGPRHGKLASVEWALGMPFRTQLLSFLRGELDVLTEVSGVDAERFAADLRWRARVVYADRPTVDGIFLNTARPPFDNAHLRRAVAFAVDPSVLAHLRPNLRPAARLLPEGLPRPREGARREYDRARALEEMQRAGYPFDPTTGRGGYPEPIDYVTVPSSLDQAVAEIYEQQLAEVGLRIRIKPLAFASFLALTGTRDACAMGWRGWHPDFPDPAAVFDPTLTSAAIAERGSQNVSFFSNPRFDEVAAHARRDPSPDGRMASYAELERIVAEDAPWVPTYSSRAVIVSQPDMRGVVATPDGRLDVLALERDTRAEEAP